MKRIKFINNFKTMVKGGDSMTKFNSLFIAIAILIVTFFFCPAIVVNTFADDVVIICNKGVSDTSLSKDDIKNIYLGKKSSWSDNTKITFVTLSDSDIQKSFLKEYINKTPSQFNTYWKKLVFTGKGKMPKSFDSDADLIDFVSKTDGALGYVSASSESDDVKVIKVQ
jgi:ABC-type phosphate transport system substrate-binding protein